MSITNTRQRGLARTQRPERHQVEMQLLALDELIDRDHRVRLVWQYVDSLDLGCLYESIKAVEGNVGRNPIDPQILFALWLYATVDGVGSARKLAKLCVESMPYRWICGGVSVNYHTLADFRSGNGDLFEKLMVQSVAVLVNQDLIPLETIAQDGMRVRANAGTGSMRRKPTLERLLGEAKEHFEKLTADGEQDDYVEELDNRKKAAQKRAAREKAERIQAALEELEEINDKRGDNKRETDSTRASMTDPEARRMKMANGGFNPALNVQFATDGDTRIIVGVDLTNSGGDGSQMLPMFQRLVSDYGKTPQEYLVDGPYATRSDITELEKAGTRVLAPIPFENKMIRNGTDPTARQPKDTDEMAAFRKRMGTDEAKERFKLRSSIAEFPNADCRNRGLRQFAVRGLWRAKGQALLHALAHNLMRFLRLEMLPALAQGT